MSDGYTSVRLEGSFGYTHAIVLRARATTTKTDRRLLELQELFLIRNTQQHNWALDTGNGLLRGSVEDSQPTRTKMADHVMNWTQDTRDGRGNDVRRSAWRRTISHQTKLPYECSHRKRAQIRRSDDHDLKTARVPLAPEKAAPNATRPDQKTA
jgi:hypothetical protein